MIPARDTVYAVIATEHGQTFVLPVHAWCDAGGEASAMVVNPSPTPKRLVTADQAAKLVRGDLVDIIDTAPQPTAEQLLADQPGDHEAGIANARDSLHRGRPE